MQCQLIVIFPPCLTTFKFNRMSRVQRSNPGTAGGGSGVLDYNKEARALWSRLGLVPDFKARIVD